MLKKSSRDKGKKKTRSNDLAFLELQAQSKDVSRNSLPSLGHDTVVDNTLERKNSFVIKKVTLFMIFFERVVWQIQMRHDCQSMRQFGG